MEDKAYTWPYPRHAKFEADLRRAAAQWFDEKGLARHSKYPYCLASRDEWHQNIIVPRVAQHIKAEIAKRAAQGKGFALHKWIHHGLSSQALLFNLIGPLVVSDDLSPLQMLFAQRGVPWPEGSVKACFEYENRAVFNEVSGQPTSVDLVFTDESGSPRVFIECKLVEREFGGCSVFAQGDCDGRNPAADFARCYLHYIGRHYWTVLDNLGFVTEELKKDSMCILANHYQFFREAGLALQSGGSFVLLSDERSPTFCCKGLGGERGLMAYLLRFVPDPMRHRIATVTIQEVVAAIKAWGRHTWITEFERKYGMA